MLVPRQPLQRSSSVWCACKWYRKPCGEKYVRVQPAIVHAMLSLAPFRLGARDTPWCKPPTICLSTAALAAMSACEIKVKHIRK